MANKQITMTREGGRFYRAQAWSLAVTYSILPLVLVVLILAVLNPFWFRNDMFTWVERRINQFARWRANKTYSIYLGCDPKIWHALKDPQN
jgi:hypothetical protein